MIGWVASEKKCYYSQLIENGSNGAGQGAPTVASRRNTRGAGLPPCVGAEVRSSDINRIAQTADAVAPDLDNLDCDA